MQLKTSKPLMGICRGMQMIAKYFDAIFLDPIDNHVSKKIKYLVLVEKKLFVIIISNLEIAQIIFIFWQNQMMVALKQ